MSAPKKGRDRARPSGSAVVKRAALAASRPCGRPSSRLRAPLAFTLATRGAAAEYRGDGG